MSKKIHELEELVDFLSIAIARERDSIEQYTRAYHNSLSASTNETVQQAFSLLVRQEKEHEMNLREQLNNVKLEIMRTRGSRRIETSIVINAPPEKVFALIDNEEKMAELNDTIKEAKVNYKWEKGFPSKRVGKRIHYVGEAGGSSGEWESEVTEWVENERIAWRTISGDFTGFGSYTLKQVEGGIELTIVMNYELPHSVFGKIVDKLKASKDIERSMARSLQNIKKLLEKK